MSNLVILFIVTISMIGPLSTVGSTNNKAVDLNTVFNFIQQLKQSSDSTTDTDDDSDEYFTEIDKAVNNRDEMLEKERIIDLIEKVAKENNNVVQDNDRNTYREEKLDRNQLTQNDKLTDAFNNNIQMQLLAKFLSQGVNKEVKTKPRIKPSRLLPAISVNEVSTRNDNDVTGLEDYSKIYVVLNPQAVERSDNKNAFNELVSKILSLSSLTSKKDNQGKRKPRRYKGFLVKEEMPQRRFRQAMANRARRYYQNREFRRNTGY
ncbi:unnamed protein product [Spodoptera littoralis]|uniref:Uncharacterized protein n=1 Tax=Spodoptera littoralis TaxID=7109 RepID=A0A9P0N2Z8_SPOLI|nr:unnamed protein product [Spodoptera littoralis]CAH1639638.1 unnamed protein product [Spodoptera littoralis]